jgi:hypothetical protein
MDDIRLPRDNRRRPKKSWLWALLLVLLVPAIIHYRSRRPVPILRNYPVCNIKCPRSTSPNSSCELKQSDFADVRNVVQQESGYDGTAVVHIETALVLISSTEAGHEALEKRWSSFACPTSPGRIPGEQGTEYARCVSHTDEWLKEYRSKPIALLFDANFLGECLNSQIH